MCKDSAEKLPLNPSDYKQTQAKAQAHFGIKQPDCLERALQCLPGREYFTQSAFTRTLAFVRSFLGCTVKLFI